jgi:hypothetical protein
MNEDNQTKDPVKESTGSRTLNDILQGFTHLIEELGLLRESHKEKYDANNVRMDIIAAENRVLLAEAEKAGKVAKKLNKLLVR